MSVAELCGLAVAFGGALLLAAGSELQSRAVYRYGGSWRGFLRSTRWWVGLGILAVAVSTNFIALSLTPVSAVQAMSIVALAASALIGGLSGRVQLTRAGIVSVVLCIGGILGFILVLTAHPQSAADASGARAHLAPVTAILAVLSVAAVLVAGIGPWARHRGARVLFPIVGALVFGATTSVFKVLVTMVAEEGWADALLTPTAALSLFVVAFGGVAANILLQGAHRYFPAPTVVAAITIVDPMTAATIGITVLGEASLTLSGGFAVVGCGLVAALGVAGVTRIRRRPVPAHLTPRVPWTIERG